MENIYEYRKIKQWRHARYRMAHQISGSLLRMQNARIHYVLFNIVFTGSLKLLVTKIHVRSAQYESCSRISHIKSSSFDENFDNIFIDCWIDIKDDEQDFFFQFISCIELVGLQVRLRYPPKKYVTRSKFARFGMPIKQKPYQDWMLWNLQHCFSG